MIDLALAFILGCLISAFPSAANAQDSKMLFGRIQMEPPQANPSSGFCLPKSNNADLIDGARVTVTLPDGSVIQGTLNPARKFRPAASPQKFACQGLFLIKLPIADSYTFQIGNREPITVKRSDLGGFPWHVQFNIP